MLASDFTIEVRNAAFGRVGQIDLAEITDFQGVKQFNNVGTWSMSLRSEYAGAALLAQRGMGIIVTGPNNKVFINGLVQDWSNVVTDTDPQGTVSFTGLDDNVFLADALCFPQPGNANVSTQNDDYDNRTGDCEDIMQQYVSYNIGPLAQSARKRSFITLSTSLSRGATVTGNARFDQLGLVLSDLATKGGMGFDMVQSGTNIVFTTYVPTDKSQIIRMDIQNDTLDKATYGFGAPSGTRIIVAGQGDGVLRNFQQYTDSTAATQEANWNRVIEVFKDRRDTNDGPTLAQEGANDLTAGREIVSLAVVPSNDQTMVYGTDWYLGDIVGVTVAGQNLSAVVTQAILSITNGGVKVGATVGQPTGFDYDTKLANAVTQNAQDIAFLQQNIGTWQQSFGSDIDAVAGTSAVLFVSPHSLAADRSRTGTISATWAFGKPVVTLTTPLPDGTATVTASLPSNLSNSSDIAPGASVIVTHTSTGGWAITSAIGSNQTFLPQIAVPPLNGWIAYSENVQNDLTAVYGDTALHGSAASVGSANSAPFYATMNQYGVVMLEGLATRNAGAPVSGTIIATLPANMVPSRGQWFAVDASGAAGQVFVDTSGNIRYYAGAVSFFSLNGIKFRAAWAVTGAVATFVPLTLISPFVAYTGSITTGDPGGAGSHTVGYTVDAEGVILFEGICTTPSATAANVNAAQCTALPATLATHQLIQSSTGSSQLGRVSATGGTPGGNFLNIGSAQSAGAVISFANMMVAPTPVGWSWVVPIRTNSWADYGSSWEGAAIGKTPSGFVYSRGLLAGGTIAASQTYLSKGFRPRYQSIQATLANSAWARQDIGAGSTTSVGVWNGSIMPQTGSNAWWTWGGLGWPAYR